MTSVPDKRKPRLLVVFGGPSGERGISINSARTITENLTDDFVIRVIYVDRKMDGYWIDRSVLYSNTPDDFDFLLQPERENKGPKNTGDVKVLIAKDATTPTKFKPEPLEPQSANANYDADGFVYLGSFEEVKADSVASGLIEWADVCFPAIHGAFGEDGRLQKVLKNAGKKQRLQIVGAGSRECETAFNKYKAKEALKDKLEEQLGKQVEHVLVDQLKSQYEFVAAYFEAHNNLLSVAGEGMEDLIWWKEKSSTPNTKFSVLAKDAEDEIISALNKLLEHARGKSKSEHEELDRWFIDRQYFFKTSKKFDDQLRNGISSNEQVQKSNGDENTPGANTDAGGLKRILADWVHSSIFVPSAGQTGDQKRCVERIREWLPGERLIVKPCQGGSSLGVKTFTAPETGKNGALENGEVEKKLAALLAELLLEGHGPDFIIEKHLTGREFTSIVLCNYWGKEDSEVNPVPLIPTEILMEDDEIFTHKKKYLPSVEVQHRCPPEFAHIDERSPEHWIRKIRNACRVIFKTLEFRDFARIDGWISENGKIDFTDFNPISGMDNASLLFQQASVVGIDHRDTLLLILSRSLRALDKSEIEIPKLGPVDNGLGVGQGKQVDREDVSVLFGGNSSERQVSTMSGTNVWLKLKRSRRYAPCPALLYERQSSSDRVVYLPTIECSLFGTVEDIVFACDRFLEEGTEFANMYRHLQFSVRSALAVPVAMAAVCQEFVVHYDDGTVHAIDVGQDWRPEEPKSTNKQAISPCIGMRVEVEWPVEGRKTKDYFPGTVVELIPNVEDTKQLPLPKPGKLSVESYLKDHNLVFNVLHGGFGENGELQEEFRKYKTRFTGSPAETAQVCMNKYETARLIDEFRIAGVSHQNQRVINFHRLVNMNTDELDAEWEILRSFLGSEKIVVKPVSDGCSFGVVVLSEADSSASELKKYIDKIDNGERFLDNEDFLHHRHKPGKIPLPDRPPEVLLFENFVETRQVMVDDKGVFVDSTDSTNWIEVTIGIWGAGATLEALVPSITVKSGGVLSLEEKFQRGAGVNLTPPVQEVKLDTDSNLTMKEVSEIAQKNALCLARKFLLQSVARIDAFLNVNNGDLSVIELNTNPGLTAATVIFHQAIKSNSWMPIDFLEKILDSTTPDSQQKTITSQDPDDQNESKEVGGDHRKSDRRKSGNLHGGRDPESDQPDTNYGHGDFVAEVLQKYSVTSTLAGPIYSFANVQGQGTFYAQQIRAFNLVWALLVSKVIFDGRGSETECTSDRSSAAKRSRVAVIGAGLAGLSVAAAAAKRGCRVEIFEQSSQLMHLQRGNDSRFIHPNIYDWPARSSIPKETELPFLNWTANYAGDVVKQIDREWEWLKSHFRIVERFRHQVTRIKPLETDPRRVLITATESNYVGEFDCVVLCTGFGIEKKHPFIDTSSYWRDDALHQEVLSSPKPKRFLVSGCGDGAVTDILRIRLRDFDQRTYIRDVMSLSSLNPRDLREKLLGTEKGAYRVRDQGEDVPLFLFNQYSEIVVNELEEMFEKRLRTDTDVVVNSTGSFPLELNASIMNRLSLFVLLKINGIRYIPGRLSDDQIRRMENGTGFSVQWIPEDQKGKKPSDLKPTDEKLVDTFHSVIIRHGPLDSARVRTWDTRPRPLVTTEADKQLPKKHWRHPQSTDVERLGWKDVPARIHSKSDEEYGVGTFFGRSSWWTRSHELKQYEVKFFTFDDIKKEKPTPFQTDFFQNQLFKPHESTLRKCVFFNAKTRKRELVRHANEYEVWIILNAGLDEFEIEQATSRDDVFYREVIGFGNLERDDDAVKQSAAELRDIINRYCTAKHPDWASLVKIHFDGEALELVRTESTPPSPLVKLFFREDRKKEAFIKSRDNPNVPRDVEFDFWGFQPQTQIFPFYIARPTRRVRLKLNASEESNLNFKIDQYSDGTSHSDFHYMNLKPSQLTQKNASLIIHNENDDKDVEAGTLRIMLELSQPEIDEAD